MKRAFPQKVKPVPYCITDCGVVVEQSKQAIPEVNRRARTSAAVIGLAISMGAHSLLITQQADDAIAAEPTGESTLTTASPTIQAMASPSGDDAARNVPSNDIRIIEHVVQEGQTIWQLSSLYGVDAEAITAANRLSSNALLQVGQVLRVPLGHRSLTGVVPSSEAIVTQSGNLIADASAFEQHHAALKVGQDLSVARMKQSQDVLRQGLSKLKGAEQGTTGSELDQSSAMAQPAAPAKVSYRVVAGDTLSAIAKTYGVSQQAIVRANRLRNANFIHVGQMLAIPGSGVTSALQRSHKDSHLVAMATKPAVEGVPVITADTNPDGILVPVSGVAVNRSNQSTEQVGSNSQRKFQGRIASLPPTQDESISSGIEATQETQVATAPFAVSPSPQPEDLNSSLKHNYVDNLRMEIVRLREKYQTPAEKAPLVSLTESKVAAIRPVVPAATEPSATEARNPEFDAASYTDSVRSQVRRLRSKAQMNQVGVANPASALKTATPSVPTLVATAPLGSQTYEPLVPSSLGQMVSPDLPPLGGVENYLPGNSGKFNGYIWPAKGLLTSGFGWRWGRMHKGIDVAAPIGTPIVAAASGVVITAGWNSGGYGNLVEVQHPDGSVTLYAHNNRILVRPGQQVEQGQQIAEMGSTGYSTGPHCHFEVHLPGHGAVNPVAYLPRAGA